MADGGLTPPPLTVSLSAKYLSTFLWGGFLGLKRLHKDQASHGIALDTPHAYVLKIKKWPKMRYRKLGFGVQMAIKLISWLCWASEWIPCVWKGCRKTRHHMASLWTPQHASISKKKKNCQKRDLQIWDVGSWMALKWSKISEMPKICIDLGHLTHYYPHVIDFKMPRQIWATVAEMAKICKNGRCAL